MISFTAPLYLTFVGQSVLICLPGKQLVVICVLKSSIQDGPSQRQWCVECIELYQDHQCWGGFFGSSCVCDHSSNSLEWLGEASKIHLVLFTQVEIILERVEEGLESVISDLWGEPCLVPLYLCLWHTYWCCKCHSLRTCGASCPVLLRAWCLKIPDSWRLLRDKLLLERRVDVVINFRIDGCVRLCWWTFHLNHLNFYEFVQEPM